MGMKGFGQIVLASVVSFLGISAVHAAEASAKIPTTEVVNLPSDAAYGGGDKIGSQLVAATYNAGEGPGVWIVADGGYRLYHNGALLAEDNQAGRVRFVPMTFLPGENAISVVGVNGKGAPGIMVQIDDLDRYIFCSDEIHSPRSSCSSIFEINHWISVIRNSFPASLQ